MKLIIDGATYDVSSYKDYHPGGKLILENLAGQDVTEAFRVFHPRSMKPFLHGLKVKRRQNPKLNDFLALEKRMHELGLFQCSALFYIEKSLILIILFATACSLRSSNLFFSAICLGMFWQQLAFVGHDVGHSSVNGRKLDFFFGTLFGNTLGGISLGWWKHSHSVHHATPNDKTRDPDVQHLPVLAVDKKMFGFYSNFHGRWFKMGWLAKFLVSHQTYLFYPVMSVARFNLYAQSLIWSLTKGSALDTLTLFAFYTWFFILAFSGDSPFTYIYVSHAMTGLLHVQICVSHFAENILDCHLDWVDRQSCTTIDVNCSPAMDWFHGGLQFQLEHHLFPRLPRENLRKASEMLDPFFKKHKIRCLRLGFFEAQVRVLKKLAETSSHAFLVDAINLRG